MKKRYHQPTIVVIAMEMEGIIANSQQYTSMRVTSADNAVDVTYGSGGITTVGIGDGGFLNVK